MSELLTIPDDVLTPIAKQLVEEDVGDRWWALFTRLLRTKRGLLEWQRKVMDMPRPLIMSFELEEVLSDLLGVLILEFDLSLKSVGIEPIRMHVTGPTGPFEASFPAKRGHVVVYSSNIFHRSGAPGRYVLRFSWHAKMAVLGLQIGYHTRGWSVEINSFGSQNIVSFGNLGKSTSASFIQWPYILPQRLWSLANFASGDRAFVDPAIQWWDTRNIREMTNFLYNTPSFRGDLSLYRIQKDCLIGGAFIGCNAAVLPQTWLQRIDTRLKWTRYAMLHSTLWDAIGLVALLVAAVAVLSSLRIRGTIWEFPLVLLAVVAVAIYIAMANIKQRRDW